MAKRARVGQSLPLEGELPAVQLSQGNEARVIAQRTSSSSNRATSGRAYHWRFKHNRDDHVTEDPASMATLAHHFKFVGCPVPTVHSTACRDEHTNLAEFYGLLMAHVNRTVMSCETKLAECPWALELDELKKVMTELTNQVLTMQARKEQYAERLLQYAVLSNKLFHSEVACDENKEKFHQADG